jgi:transcriptional regulator with XRE-family HTH domain
VGGLKAIREAKGLTQVELARRAGLSNTTISRVENDLSSPTTTTLRALAQALDMSASDLEMAINPEAQVFAKEVEHLELLAKAVEMAKAALSDGQVENAMSVLKLLEETVEDMADDMRECVRIARGEKKETASDKLDEVLREYEAATA